MASSPSVDRVASLLTYLAAHPRESFSISELGRRLDISKATCHTLVASLAEWGFVLKNPTDKQVRVGPALLSLGVMAAAENIQLVDLAAEEMKHLAETHRAQCAATAAVGDEIVVLATFGFPQSAETGLQAGQRLPLRPPFGGVHIAWAPREVQQRWLTEHGVDADAYEKVLSTMQDRGFSVALEVDPRQQVSRALRGFRGDETLESVGAALDQLLGSLESEEYYLANIADAAEYRIRHIAAPVFDATGAVAFVITVTSFGRTVTGREIMDIGEDVIASTQRVSKVISKTSHGRPR